jgi:ribosomal protein L11 methyltransferase
MTLLDSKPIRMTPARLTKTIRCTHPNLSRNMIRQAIHSLIECGDLNYSNRFGQTYVELNYHRAMHISDRIILSPPHCAPSEPVGSVLIKINIGASFGMGDHPTTRIALRGVEFAMTRIASLHEPRRIKVLDIGTGSGILAIASVKFGAAQAVGLDLDPVACHEARKNVALNKLDSSVSIHETDLERFDGERYELIMANLRPPTLKQIIPALRQISSPSAFWVFSGFRDDEEHRLIEDLTMLSASKIWQSSEYGWSGMVCGLEE